MSYRAREKCCGIEKINGKNLIKTNAKTNPSLLLMPLQWAVALAAVCFCPDEGNRIEALVPANALTAEERRAVAFASLPDSVSALDGGVLVGAAAQATSVRDR